MLSLLVFMITVQSAVSQNFPTCSGVRFHRNFHLLPQPPFCGTVFTGFRIMGGEQVQTGEFPWMAAIFRRSSDFQECGGSIVSSKYVLTAAHCLPLPEDASDLFLIVGEVNLAKRHNPGLPSSGMVYDVEQIIIHHLFHKQIAENDIGLIRTVAHIQFNDFISPICLPTDCTLLTMDYVNKNFVRVMGWGKLYEVPRIMETTSLHYIPVRVMPTSVCAQFWPSFSDSHICTSTVHGKSACMGDSGGPLTYIYPQPPARTYQIGVVSYGRPCNSQLPENTPNVLTRVAFYLPWILDHLHD